MGDKVKPDHDIFSPCRPIAQAIYDAFQSEASHRDGREWPDWERMEMEAVHAEVNRQRALLGKPPVSLESVQRVDAQACGHVDYGARLAYGCEELVNAEA